MPSELERYGFSVITPAATEPVTLVEAKNHCRIDPYLADDDAEIENELIPAARRLVEVHAGACLLTQTVKMTLDYFPLCGAYSFPYGGEVRLPVGPVQSVTSITYVDASGATQTFSPSDYKADLTTTPARIWPAWGKSWPITRYEPAAVAVTYVAGYTSAALVPAGYRRAIKALVRAWYDGTADVGTMIEAVARELSILAEGLPHGAA